MERYQEFKNECSTNPASVKVWPVAADNAATDFAINGADRLKDVIANDGLANVIPIGQNPYEKDPTGKITVFDYTFEYARKHGYMAFMKDRNGRWVLKSFKKNIARSEIENTPFAALLSDYKVNETKK